MSEDFHPLPSLSCSALGPNPQRLLDTGEEHGVWARTGALWGEEGGARPGQQLELRAEWFGSNSSPLLEGQKAHLSTLHYFSSIKPVLG